MSAYGYEIVQTLIVDIEPDVHVKRAMNEINAGKTFQELILNKDKKKSNKIASLLFNLYKSLPLRQNLR